jgi:hypothetical protein
MTGSVALPIGATVLSIATVGLTLTGCATASVPTSTFSEALRVASLKGSELCILNETGKTIPLVQQLGDPDPDSHPDAPGPVAPGGKWCSNGYNSYTDSFDIFDVTAQIFFTADRGDEARWGAINKVVMPPGVRYGNGGFSDGFGGWWGNWETDVSLQRDGYPNHDFHIRRLDDTEFFKEWLITVRS